MIETKKGERSFIMFRDYEELKKFGVDSAEMYCDVIEQNPAGVIIAAHFAADGKGKAHEGFLLIPWSHISALFWVPEKQDVRAGFRREF
ncbi:MAG: hypothetical protein HYU64_14210 [Armatimonadetes bacterium]|nr:hypothetical protein [Armatimonadota bacterium]